LALPRGGGDFRAAVLAAPVALAAATLTSTWACPARPGTVSVALRRDATLARAALGVGLLPAPRVPLELRSAAPTARSGQHGREHDEATSTTSSTSTQARQGRRCCWPSNSLLELVEHLLAEL
jgi:hypothetical protein